MQDTYIFSTFVGSVACSHRVVLLLGMSKNLQLDLFGAAPEPTPPPAEPIVFADDKIVVKIKAKTPSPSEPLAERIPEPIAEPITEPITERVLEPSPESMSTIPIKSESVSKRGRKSFREMDSELDLIEVPDEDTLQQKLYYSISEVASWFRVNTSLLRYWENEFDILQPRKTRKGDRLFRVEDIKNLQLIYFLLRDRKFSIEGARNYLKQNKQQVDTQLQLVQSLHKFRSFLLELKSTL